MFGLTARPFCWLRFQYSVSRPDQIEMLVPTGHDDGSAALLLKSTCAVCGAEIQYRSGMSLDFTMDFFVVRFTVCKIDRHIFSCFLTRTSPKEDAAVCHTHSFTNSLLESGFAGRGC